MTDDVPQPVSVTIAVSGHQVTVEAHTDLDVVAGKALELFEATSSSARQSSIGFGIPHGQFEAQPGYVHMSRAEVES